MLKKIAIFCGGPSSEHEVSISSAKNIYQFLDKEKYDPFYFYISKELKVKFENCTDDFAFQISESDPDFIEIITKLKTDNYFALLAGIHGEFAEDGKLQTILEILKIPYSGSDSKSSMLAMDKNISSLIAKDIKDLTIPKTSKVSKTQHVVDYDFPVLVKPNELGSSVGLHIVKNKTELEKALNELQNVLKVDNILIQEFLENTIELSCGCLQNKDLSFIKLPPIEIQPKKGEYFDYASKYEVGGSEEITPPVSIPKELSDKISDIACKLHELLGLKTYSRSDFLIKENKIYYLETNTLPGMTSTSLLPQEAAAAGISFPQLLDFIIEN